MENVCINLTILLIILLSFKIFFIWFIFHNYYQFSEIDILLNPVYLTSKNTLSWKKRKKKKRKKFRIYVVIHKCAIIFWVENESWCMCGAIMYKNLSWFQDFFFYLYISQSQQFWIFDIFLKEKIVMWWKCRSLFF